MPRHATSDATLKLFPGKLSSRWTGPFTIAKVHTYGAIELIDPEKGTTFKVNGQRVKLFYTSAETAESGAGYCSCRRGRDIFFQTSINSDSLFVSLTFLSSPSRLSSFSRHQTDAAGDCDAAGHPRTQDNRKYKRTSPVVLSATSVPTITITAFDFNHPHLSIVD
ncbi:hypothetical protein OSB04_001258 [Centaurea solstitialis]|uniref:Reverse transcriptase domain-containing protein n=1 Tax=Centaurea solstitialis TaxID=347529 RepID=A0AA38WL97_9ASTR|nr:hypothetical protein OSB04_001258 [Centaurea solstitialis]